MELARTTGRKPLMHWCVKAGLMGLLDLVSRSSFGLEVHVAGGCFLSLLERVFLFVVLNACGLGFMWFRLGGICEP